ncbi:MAG: N-6 DNA methylase [Desulfobacula sp.]|nr:N-6 DNA methylase [Desulfobacula sp.]
MEDNTWTPAAGIFEGWPLHLGDLKTLDPCCGSGHFLVAAFLMLVPMRMEMESLSAEEAVDAVLKENINGLEIDRRCVELAAFALALTAWRYPGASGYRVLPELNLACSGLSISTQKEEWISLAGDNPDLKMALGELYNQFKDAPILGSLINPESSLKKETFFPIKWEEVNGLLKMVLAGEQDDEKAEMGVVAKGISKAANILSDKYSLVITNVPYLTRGKQDETLRDFCESHYKEGKNDLATVFLDRCLEFCEKGGTTSVVLPQNWLFLTSYKKFREKLLKRDTWHLIARLGPGAFETISGEVVKAILINLSRGNLNSCYDNFIEKKEHGSIIRGVDVSELRTAAQKAIGLLIAESKCVKQMKQLENQDSRVGFFKQNNGTIISLVADCYQGLVTGDIERFTKKIWEIVLIKGAWKSFRRSNNSNQCYGNVSEVLLWEKGRGKLHSYAKTARNKLHDMHESGNKAWGKNGVAINRMGDLKAVPYYGEHFDNNVAVVFALNDEKLNPTLLCFFESKDFSEAIRDIDQTLKVTNRTLLKIPFDLDYWTKITKEKYPNGLPKPYSDDPTQWIFHGHPAQSDDPLQVATARLLGYRWPAEQDRDMELAEEARTLATDCDDLLDLADGDGIVCIPAVRGEMKAEDRLERLLARAFGQEWSSAKKNELLTAVGHGGKTLESWLREKFFTQHCKLFHHRPFIWHIWDGLNDGFAALVNYHKLDDKLLETLIYTYLGDWISRQGRDVDSRTDGAQEKLSAALSLKKKLELILEGEDPYDIFVRWKPIEMQPIGWNPDLNDGVRMNIRPFMSVSDVQKRGAGVLRDKPNIKWGKDRGKDVETAPWYPLFKGDRINDHHLRIEEKQAARKEALA